MGLIKRAKDWVRPHLFASEKTYDKSLKIFFLHLPKCGGSSIRNAFSEAFHPRQIAELHPHASREAAELLGEDMLTYRASLLPYYMAMNNAHVLTGHFPWSDDAYNQFGADWSYVTVLRDPVKRWFSHYFYDRYKTHSDHFRIEDDLDTFIKSERALQMGNLYVRRLSNPGTERPDAVKQAKANLRKFQVIGLTENLKGFVSRFNEQFGVELHIPRKNESPAQDKKRNAYNNDRYRRVVESICESDIVLYEYAKSLVDAERK